LKFIVNEANVILASQDYSTLQQMKGSLRNNESGFYWIYTNLSIEALKNSQSPTNAAHVKINELARIHENLTNIHIQNGSDFWCIYNGKGMQLKTRINAEFSDTAGPTGTLALTRCFNENDFRVKYVSCGNPDFNYEYNQIEAHFERAWRLDFGWPILCRA